MAWLLVNGGYRANWNIVLIQPEWHCLNPRGQQASLQAASAVVTAHKKPTFAVGQGMRCSSQPLSVASEKNGVVARRVRFALLPPLATSLVDFSPSSLHARAHTHFNLRLPASQHRAVLGGLTAEVDKLKTETRGAFTRCPCHRFCLCPPCSARQLH
jgi:hypothetical protein